jgi:phage terminase large subunit-like protein
MAGESLRAIGGRVGNTNTTKRARSLERPPWRSWRTRSRSARAIRFIESYCVTPKGHGAGEPVKLARFQRELLEAVLDDTTVRSAVCSIARGNGKSTLTAAVALWALHDDEHSPEVPVVATTLAQAIRTVWNSCRRMTEVSPELADRTIVYTAVGATRLYVPWNNGALFPLPADPDGLQGLDPSFAVVDEVGFVSQDLWDAMVLASGKRPRSLVLGIGTPNVEQAGAMWELRERVRSGRPLPGFRWIEHAADEGCDTTDRVQWRKANPAIGAGFLAEDALEMAQATSPEASFRVYRLGLWAQAAECWLPPGAWEACEAEGGLVDGAPTWVGVDVGLRRDSTAVAVVQRRPDGRVWVEATVWDPSAGVVDLADVMAFLRALCDRYTVREIVFDPRLFELPARELLDEGLPMVEFPQQVDRMAPACAHAYEMIVAGKVAHGADPMLTAHVLAAQQRPYERGWTLSKNRSRRHIDGAIAMVLALWRAAQPEHPAPQPAVWFL